MTEITKLIYQYLRHDKKFPHVWCPGCGIGILLGSLIRAIDDLKYTKDEIVLVSGIGCSGRMPVYADFNTLHTTHGRALTFATGIKLAKPDLKVIVIMGDGDAMAIGGNHFIHAARRNIDLTAMIVNNSILRHDRRAALPDHALRDAGHDHGLRDSTSPPSISPSWRFPPGRFSRPGERFTMRDFWTNCSRRHCRKRDFPWWR